MIKPFRVLIIDDHPLIVEAYKMAIDRIQLGIELKQPIIINLCYTIEEALRVFDDLFQKESLNLTLLDLKLPKSNNSNILSGEDLGLLIRKKFPESKIIISTTFNDNFKIHSIFRSIDPDGFLIKNDVNPEELITAIKCVIFEPPYYSKSVIRLLRKQISNDFLLDDIDRMLLYQLSIGTKMNELPDILPLSLAGVEKRKRKIKEAFAVVGKGDKALFQIARERGFL